MNVRLKFRWSLAAALMLACGLAGCARNPEAQFAWRESTLDLLPEARRALQNSIKEQFGTPDHLVAWERMPVNYGGIKGTIVPPQEGEQLAAREFAVSWGDQPAPELKVGDEVTWLTGPAASSKIPTLVVASRDNGRVLTLSGVVESSAEPTFANATFIVNFGSQLQFGRMVYMRNCMHCHGVAGDGAGPTAKYLNPRPRDYRLGVFKFTETMATERVTRSDLHRIIQDGIPGTYMPSFLLLGEDETTAVIEYVLWLAMRGEMEKRMGDELVDYAMTSVQADYDRDRNSYDAALAAGEKPDSVPSLRAMVNAARTDSRTYLEEDFADTVDGTADFIAENWRRAEDPASVVIPGAGRVADTVASRENGRLLFLSDKTKCYTCHGTTGKGNGAAIEDFWPKPGSTEKYTERGLHDVWGEVLQPRNLRLGQYRGGRRPIDVYRRIYAGIKGTPMPAFGGTVLKDEEIWDIVNYVMNLPYESESATPAAASSQVAARPVQ